MNGKSKDEIRWNKNRRNKRTWNESRAIKKEMIYWAGSFNVAKEFTKEDNHNIYICKNNQLIGWIDVKDEIRPEAKISD